MASNIYIQQDFFGGGAFKLMQSKLNLVDSVLSKNGYYQEELDLSIPPEEGPIKKFYSRDVFGDYLSTISCSSSTITKSNGPLDIHVVGGSTTNCAKLGPVTTDVKTNNVVWFNNGQDIPASPTSNSPISFQIVYKGGCFQYGREGHDWLVGDGSFKIVDENGNVLGNAPGDWNQYKDYTICSNRQFPPFTIRNFQGGKIGLQFTDSDYSDNIVGVPTNPKYKLIPV